MGSPVRTSAGQRLISVCVNSSDFPLLIRASSGLPAGLQNLLRGFNSFRPCQYVPRARGEAPVCKTGVSGFKSQAALQIAGGCRRATGGGPSLAPARADPSRVYLR